MKARGNSAKIWTRVLINALYDFDLALQKNSCSFNCQIQHERPFANSCLHTIHAPFPILFDAIYV
jgi:hypothetical protein